ncbi:hypothetical protein D5086_027117 [Populus alba]|uniref:Uncharacterized protein n=1 Tax=Populus alba TaxID=43335 RepID=A0ACC4B5I9_POPAL
MPITLIQPTHAPINVDLTVEGTPDNRSLSLMDRDKLFALKERLRAVEGNDWFDLCEQLKIYFELVHGLDSVRIRSWRDLLEVFLKQYKFNLEITLDRTSLMSMEKRRQESVRAYAAEIIEQGIKAGRIVEPLQMKGFIGRKMEGHINNFEGGSKGKIYKPELTCEYHAGIPGHDLETCYAFKKRLLELIKIGWVSSEDTPNINSNPLPSHDASNSG